MTRHQFFPACPPFVNTVYFHVNFLEKNSVVLTTNMAVLSRGCKPRIILIVIWITCPYGSTLHAIPFDCKRQDSNLISRESSQILQNSNQCWRPDCHFISFQFLEFFVCDSDCTVKHFVTTQYSMNVKFIGNWFPLDCYLSWARLVKCSNINGRLTWGYKKERKTNYNI